MGIKRIDINNPEERKRLSGWLDNVRLANVYIKPEFQKAFLETYRLRGHYLVCLKKGKLSAVASFYERRNLGGPKGLVSIPSGFWAKDSDAEEELINALREIVLNQRLKGPYFRNLYNPLLSLRSQNMAYRAVRYLDGDEEELLSSYSKNIRRDIRIAEKNGLIVKESNDVQTFYSIWAHNMRDLGTPPMPIRLFYHLKKYFNDKVKILSVFKNNKAIGGAFIIRNHEYATDMCLSSLRPYFRYYPNTLLYHKMLTWASERGVKIFDLGRSQPGSGNEIFKLRFRAKLLPLYYYPYIRNSSIEKITKSIFIKIWKRFPVTLSNKVGPLLRMYIPFA
ncbi:MAG: GNAT family N-acetyltransferase [Deltaproteobacteria bacterium]|nr:GNAT family N-acetyltransferase [Deltaproteobacteria bacterium]